MRTNIPSEENMRKNNIPGCGKVNTQNNHYACKRRCDVTHAFVTYPYLLSNQCKSTRFLFVVLETTKQMNMEKFPCSNIHGSKKNELVFSSFI